MNAQTHISNRSGFTLIEVLAALGLCAFLATATAAAIAFSSRAERMATRAGDAALLLQARYAAQRLRPDDLPAPPSGWRIEVTTKIFTLPDESLREWHELALADDYREITPFVFRILDDTP